jgi:hypothetical protein
MATTASALITGAYDLLGVYAAGETISTADQTDGLRRLNNLVGQWATQNLTIPVTSRTVHALTANKGGTTLPYTIGPGGDFTESRPSLGFTGVGLVLGGTSPAVELPRALLTDDQYQAIPIKDMGNPLFTSVYYNATYTAGLGSIYLWPVPDNALHSLVLYRFDQIPVFADWSSTSYIFPPGYEEAIEYNLAVRLAAPNGKPVPPDVATFAARALSNIKKANSRIIELPCDPMFTRDRRGGYNIVTGEGG